MTPSIQRRVEALEAAGAAATDFILILRRIITPGVPAGEATQAKMLGLHFVREPSESEADFIERLRAYALAHRRPGQHGVQVLMDETDLDL
jgi:hypothetical protein